MSVATMFAQRHPHVGGGSGILHPGGAVPPASAPRARPAPELPAPTAPRAVSSRQGAGGGAVTVRAADDVPAHVTVGPHLFDLTLGLHMADTRGPADVIQAYYRGGSLTVEGEPTPRWLAYIQAARDRHEQTVEAFRDPRGYIFYRTMHALRAGQELLVWYGDELARECGIPVLTPSNIRGDQQYVCTTCHKSYKHPNCLKAHIRFRCAPTRPDFLSSSRSMPDSWLRLGPSPPRRSSETPRSPEVRSLSPSTSGSGPAGPMNLKVGQGSAFRPPRRESGSSDVSRQSPDSTRDLRESPREARKEKPSPTGFRSRSPPASSAPTTATSTTAPTTPASEKRYDLPSPSKAVSLKDVVGTKFPLRSDVPACAPQPVQIFNHIHPPAFPVPMDSATLKYYYTPLYNKLTAASAAAAAAAAGQMCYGRMLTKPTCLPASYLDAMYYPNHHPAHAHHASYGHHHKLGARSPPGGDQENHKLEDALKASPHHPNMSDAAPEGACLPFAFPLPSEKAGEPLDLLPRSLYMHKSRKGHLCIYCGKLYSRKYGLKIHLRTHTGYKPLKCKVCLRPFGDPSNLNKHIRLHAEGDTPYRCDHCGKVLVRRRDLERHIKSRHPGQALRGASDNGEVSSSRSELLLGGAEDDELLVAHPSSPSAPRPDSSSGESAESVGSMDHDDDSKDYIDVEDEEEDEVVVGLGPEGCDDMDDTEIEVVS